MPVGEQPWALYVATKPETTPEGKFYDENIEDLVLFWPSETYQWSPTSALYAATYWWLVESVSREGFTLYRSIPISFKIPVQIQILGLRIRRYNFLRNLDFELRHGGNVRELVVQMAVRNMRGRVLWSVRRTETSSIGSTNRSMFSWYAKRNVRSGARIRLTATVRSQGTQRTLTRILRSP
jgi:hypothetical protein